MQSLPELQVVPILFRHSLKDSDDEIVRNLDHIFGVKPLKITSPSTDSGVSLALRVLEGRCLLHPGSAVLAHQHNAIQVLMNILPACGVVEQGACLDALIAIMLDSLANQMDFGAFHGIEEVAELVGTSKLMRISGGHINPAVTFGLFLARKLSLTRAVFYIIKQGLGAMAGAGVVKGFQKKQYELLGGGANVVNHGYTKGDGLGAEIVGTYVLVYTVFSATDAK